VERVRLRVKSGKLEARADLDRIQVYLVEYNDYDMNNEWRKYLNEDVRQSSTCSGQWRFCFFVQERNDWVADAAKMSVDDIAGHVAASRFANKYSLVKPGDGGFQEEYDTGDTFELDLTKTEYK